MLNMESKPMKPRPLWLPAQVENALDFSGQISRVGPEGRHHWGRLFTIEGNIGAGKSELLTMIKEAAPALDACIS